MPRQSMAAAAKSNGCSYSSFNQMQVINEAPANIGQRGGGICYGLAVTWLESKLKGNSEGFLDNAKDIEGSSIFARSHLFWRNQDTAMWKQLTGLSYVENKKFDETKTFANWISGSFGMRYFLVHVRGHTMAACGSMFKGVEFFDPNAGIVSSRRSNNIAKCLSDYFATEKIKEAYEAHPQNRVILNVERFI
ncbi:MAG: YopT-type cysteine protease domain-containing protein [Candidatus Sedimenticola sp. (ex Thyasira tokunagai)]